MSIRITGLAALVAAMLLASGASSQASYTLTTSVTNITGDTNLQTITSGQVLTMNNQTGGTFTVTATNGGYSFTDAAGSNVYLLNDVETGNPIGVVNEQVFVSVAPGVTDNSTFNFQTLVSVNGTQSFTISIGQNILGGTGYTVDTVATNPGSYSLVGGTATINPPSVTNGSLLITNLNVAANSGNTNSPSNPSVSASFISTAATTPEPASLAMLGLGLAGVGGFTAIRRRNKKSA